MRALLLVCVLVGSASQALAQSPGKAGWEAIQRGDGEKAAAAFKTELALNPNDSRLLTGAGLAAHLLGHDDQAIVFLKRAVQADGKDGQATYELAQLAYAQGDRELAVKSLERAVKLSPGDAGMYQLLVDWKATPVETSQISRASTTRRR